MSQVGDLLHGVVQLVANVYNINPHPHWEIFLALLCFLFALHLYWCVHALPSSPLHRIFMLMQMRLAPFSKRLSRLCLSNAVHADESMRIKAVCC